MFPKKKVIVIQYEVFGYVLQKGQEDINCIACCLGDILLSSIFALYIFSSNNMNHFLTLYLSNCMNGKNGDT
jgi:hypothetical protein